MPAGWVAGAAALAGAGASIYGANKAASTQGSAAANANQLQAQQYGDTVARNQPFVTGGTDAYNALLGRLGLAGSSDTTPGYGSLGKVPTAADVMATPGYQFGLDQGQAALGRSEASQGINGGAALKAAAQYGTDYATTKYNNAFGNLQSANQQAYNQLSGAAQFGQASANNTASAGAQFATQAGNNLTGASNASGAASIATGNALSNFANQGASIYKNSGSGGYNQYNGLTGYSGNPGNDGAGVSTGGSGYNPAADSTGYWADGGPVRSEPKVGTYSPLPGGGGGGLSKAALVNALMQAQMQARQPQPQTGVGTLPANPLTNPRAIIENQLDQNGVGTYADGGQVRAEPKVGTYGPVRGGGGGGMSRDAILQALQQRAAPPVAASAPYGIGALPTNPITNPGGILAAQMQKMEGDYATGGEVAGPGTQTSDSIPARLSNGEHVMDAASVTALGDGDNDKGQMLLNEMRARLKIHARNVKA